MDAESTTGQQSVSDHQLAVEIANIRLDAEAPFEGATEGGETVLLPRLQPVAPVRQNAASHACPLNRISRCLRT